MNNIFVLGLEPFNRRLLESLPHGASSRFIELLTANHSLEIGPDFTLAGLRHMALDRIERRGGADAVLNYWDFPGCCLAPLLARDLGLPGPGLKAVARCEHKYLARQAMAASIPEMTPSFCLVHPETTTAPMAYPFWLKPLVSHSSWLGFRIDNDEDLVAALAAMRPHLPAFGEPFREFMELAGVDPELMTTGCIAESIIGGSHQVTIEGYSCDGEIVMLGAVDSIREAVNGSSFARYQYPSAVEPAALVRMMEATRRLVRQIGLDQSCFNVEFFWDQSSDVISVLEINSRLSKSHAPLFHLVDGQTHQAVGLDLALGRQPCFRHCHGDWPVAAKFMLRSFQDAEMVRVPDQRHFDELATRYPDAMIQVLVEEGQRLSEMGYQDSFSFELADLFFGGLDEEDLMAKYATALSLLPFDVRLVAPRAFESADSSEAESAHAPFMSPHVEQRPHSQQ